MLEFLKALPELLRLFRVLEARLRAAGVERKTAEDVKTIHNAFASNDPKKLNELFNARPKT